MERGVRMSWETPLIQFARASFCLFKMEEALFTGAADLPAAAEGVSVLFRGAVGGDPTVPRRVCPDFHP